MTTKKLSNSLVQTRERNSDSAASQPPTKPWYLLSFEEVVAQTIPPPPPPDLPKTLTPHERLIEKKRKSKEKVAFGSTIASPSSQPETTISSPRKSQERIPTSPKDMVASKRLTYQKLQEELQQIDEKIKEVEIQTLLNYQHTKLTLLRANDAKDRLQEFRQRTKEVVIQSRQVTSQCIEQQHQRRSPSPQESKVLKREIYRWQLRQQIDSNIYSKSFLQHAEAMIEEEKRYQSLRERVQRGLKAFARHVLTYRKHYLPAESQGRESSSRQKTKKLSSSSSSSLSRSSSNPGKKQGIVASGKSKSRRSLVYTFPIAALVVSTEPSSPSVAADKKQSRQYMRRSIFAKSPPRNTSSPISLVPSFHDTSAQLSIARKLFETTC